MSDEIEVVVTIEPDFIDFETACKALGNVGKGEWWQLVDVGLINAHKISERTVFGWRKCGGSPSCAGGLNREMYSRASGHGRCGPASIVGIHAGGSWSDTEVNAGLTVGRPNVSVISQTEIQLALVVDSKRVLS